ncbi:MAG: thiamine-monophosphate kinase [Planctomycetes bacterium]|nr:thiamine-monophosphate kinase [Planctomycetota bacterium]
MPYDELEFVEWLRRRQSAHPAVALGIGDDMAALTLPPGFVLVSSDMLLDGIHFDTARHAPALIGRKAIACGLSDCAAMAVQPVAATVSVALPVSWGSAESHALYEGLFALAAEFGTAIVGGDTTRWPNPLAVDVTIAAVPLPGIDPVTRSGARVGDQLYVTGALGGSILGRHLTFTPRITAAREIAHAAGIRLHAMMDISDGLSLDLWRLCQASGVGAILEESLLASVIHEDARTLAARDGKPPLDHAFSDGEDFELLIALADDDGGGSDTRHGGVAAALGLIPIGRMADKGLQLRRCDGTLEPLVPRGYVH